MPAFPQQPIQKGFYTACALALVCLGGCASLSNWSADEMSNDAAKSGLPLRKVARSIELESRFIQIQFDRSNPDQLQSMWQWCDETILPIETRKMLATNGLRIGRVVQYDRLETKLQALRSQASRDVLDEFLSSASIASRQREGVHVDPVRIGKRAELPVRSPNKGDEVVMINEHGKLHGKTLSNPQYLFAMTPELGRNTGSVRLRLRPEIQHGDVQQNWVQGDAATRIDTRRQSWSLDNMEFMLEGQEGDVFLIAETASRRGLGRQMFGDKDINQFEQQTVLLLKIANVPTPAEKL